MSTDERRRRTASRATSLLEIKRPAHRRLERRQVASDRQRRRPHAEARRGAGPDRRIRRRQVDDRPRRHGLCAARLPHQPAARSSSTASICCAAARTAAQAPRHAHRLCRAKRRRRLQSRAPLDRPDGRDRGRPRSHRARQGRSRTPSISSAACGCPIPKTIGQRYPASGLGRPAAARHDGDGHVLPARPHHLRRADHGARRHHADRGAGRDRATSSSSSSTAAIYITHDLAVVAQMATASWCCATASWSRRRRPARC